mgnify:CR=1 FL=1
MSLSRKITIISSTFFYTGYLPLVPGTFGSLAGLLVYYFIKDNGIFFAAGALICTAVGFLVAGRAERELGKKDSKHIVIDEASGMLLSLLFLPVDLKLVLLAFVLFRILDTLKPFPADRIQELKGSMGVMGDDLIAALYTNLILQLALRFASFKAS